MAFENTITQKNHWLKGEDMGCGIYERWNFCGPVPESSSMWGAKRGCEFQEIRWEIVARMSAPRPVIPGWRLEILDPGHEQKQVCWTKAQLSKLFVSKQLCFCSKLHPIISKMLWKIQPGFLPDFNLYLPRPQRPFVTKRVRLPVDTSRQKDK